MNVFSSIIVTHLEDAQFIDAQKLATKLRELLKTRDIPVLTALSSDKPRKIFTTAEKLGAKSVVFVGPSEAQTQVFSMKDLISGQQTQGSAEQIAQALS